MASYEIYAKIRDSKGLKDGKVAELAGIGRSTFSDWKSGRSTPKENKLNKIADALGVEPYAFSEWKQLSFFDNDEIFGTVIKEESEYHINNDFTEYEVELINKFRQADDLTKDMIVRLLSFASEQDNNKERK